MKNVEFVIAKYKEDTHWTNDLHPFRVTIYDKSENGNLPNVGREAHTYIHHIIENYDNLADVTVFLQGNPFEHINISQDELKKKVASYTFDKTEPFFGSKMFYEKYIIKHDPTNTTNGAYEIIFGNPLHEISFPMAALWIVQREDILRRPIEFYKRLYYFMNIDPNKEKKIDRYINAWTLERLWQIIFNTNIPVSPNFYTHEIELV